MRAKVLHFSGILKDVTRPPVGRRRGHKRMVTRFSIDTPSNSPNFLRRMARALWSPAIRNSRHFRPNCRMVTRSRSPPPVSGGVGILGCTRKLSKRALFLPHPPRHRYPRRRFRGCKPAPRAVVTLRGYGSQQYQRAAPQLCLDYECYEPMALKMTGPDRAGNRGLARRGTRRHGASFGTHAGRRDQRRRRCYRAAS